MVDTLSSYSISGLTITKQADTSLLINGTISSNQVPQVVLMNVNYPSGTYRLSIKDENGNGYNADVYLNGAYTYKNQNDKTFVQATDIKTIRLYIYLNSGTYTDRKIYIQFEKGSTTTYEPYTGKTYPINLPNGMELCKIPNTNYKDKFFKAINGNTIYDNLDSTIKNTLDYGNWYLEKNIGKVVLDGTQTPFYGVAQNDYYLFQFSNNLFHFANKQIYSNKFTNSSNWSADIESLYVQTSGVNELLQGKLLKSRLSETSTTAVKNWFGSNNTSVYYVLATPTYTKIEGTLASQLENIYNAMSKKGQTNITQVNNDLALIINAWALIKN